MGDGIAMKSTKSIVGMQMDHNGCIPSGKDFSWDAGVFTEGDWSITTSEFRVLIANFANRPIPPQEEAVAFVGNTNGITNDCLSNLIVSDENAKPITSVQIGEAMIFSPPPPSPSTPPPPDMPVTSVSVSWNVGSWSSEVSWKLRVMAQNMEVVL